MSTAPKKKTQFRKTAALKRVHVRKKKKKTNERVGKGSSSTALRPRRRFSGSTGPGIHDRQDEKAAKRSALHRCT
jgi:hypothetical protein